VPRAQVVVYVTREHPVSGADQLLVFGESAPLVPKGSVNAAETIEDAARRTVLEATGIESRLLRELGQDAGSRFVQSGPDGPTPDEWEHRSVRCRWIPVGTELSGDRGAFLPALLRRRVVAYVTRECDGRTELLTIEHRDLPEAGVQVPAGRVDHGENLVRAVRREVAEETGLDDTRVIRRLPGFEAEYESAHESHGFHLVAEAETPDTWEHEVRGEGSDAGLVYVCSWLPLSLDLRLWNGRDPMLRHLPIEGKTGAMPCS
jgi:8-oxo-dGTP diphosphatase